MKEWMDIRTLKANLSTFFLHWKDFFNELCSTDGYIEERRADIKKKEGKKAGRWPDFIANRFWVVIFSSIFFPVHSVLTFETFQYVVSFHGPWKVFSFLDLIGADSVGEAEARSPVSFIFLIYIIGI